MKNLKGKIKELIGRFQKWDYLLNVTGVIGKVFEEEDRFVCLVDEKKLDFNSCIAGQLHLDGYVDSKKYYYNINKPICYVFEGMEFDRLVLSTDDNVFVIFDNCQFSDSVILKDVNDITFRNNKHYNSDTLKYGIINKYLKGSAKNLRFIGDNFYNKDMSYDYSYFDIDLTADSLDIIDTDINTQKFVAVKENKCVKKQRNISLNVNSMVINNSIINASSIKLNCNEIDNANSKIIGKNEVIVNEENNKMDISSVTSPKFIYNDKEVIDGKCVDDDKTDNVKNETDSLCSINSSVNYEKVIEKIVLKRIALIKALMRFQNISQEMGIEKSINRTLKRTNG